MASAHHYPPPTTNTLEPARRKQLLKSTQKLGALLGSTPRVLEPESLPSFSKNSNAKPFRREGKLLYNQSASSSQTSFSSGDGESFLYISSPPEKPSRRHYKNASSPIAIEFSHRVKPETAVLSKPGHRKSKSSHHRGTASAQQLSQPYLYRLRSVPRAPSIISLSSTISGEKPLSSPATRCPSITSASKPGNEDKELSESDRRRKMAKLMRTFGENVPLELVFPTRSDSLPVTTSAPAATTTTSTATTATTTTTTTTTSPAVRITRRNRSVTSVHRSKSQNSKKDVLLSVPPVPTLPHIESSIVEDDVSLTSPVLTLQSPIITVTTITTDASGATITTTPKPKRKNRPRSLSLTHIPMGQYKGIIVEQDQQSTRHGHVGRQPSRSLDETDRSMVMRYKHGEITTRSITTGTPSTTSTTNVGEFGYRKERDWSGEWNLEDMEDVMGALRCLRVR